MFGWFFDNSPAKINKTLFTTKSCSLQNILYKRIFQKLNTIRISSRFQEAGGYDEEYYDKKDYQHIWANSALYGGEISVSLIFVT